MNVTHQSQKSTVSQKPPVKTPSVTSKLPPSKPGTIIQGENPNIEEGEDPLQNVPQSQKIPNIRMHGKKKKKSVQTRENTVDFCRKVWYSYKVVRRGESSAGWPT